MKKIIIILFITMFFLTGCTDNKVEKEKEIYVKYVQELKKVKKTTDNLPFEVEVRFDKITNDEVRYQVIMDNVKEDVNNLEAIVIHDKQTTDIFPSIGIFDEKQDLLVGKKPSGVILVGYIDYQNDIKNFKCNIKVLMKYETDNKKTNKVYYVTKN